MVQPLQLYANFIRVSNTLLTLISIVLLLPTSLLAQAPDENSSKTRLFAYVGTFSSPLKDTLPTQVDLPPGNGQGIHIFEVNRESGHWTAKGIVRMGNSPSHLAINEAGTRLYSANETDRVDSSDGHPQKQGTISSFKVDRKTGQLKLINTVASGGAGPTYVSIHSSGRYLFAANYFGGSIAVLPIQDDGSLSEPSDIQRPMGELGPTQATNAPQGSFAFSGHDRTHAHMVKSDPTGEHVLHVDLGLDKIFVWRFDQERGKLSAASAPFVSLPPGDGPRHFAFHSNSKWLYSIQEEGSTIVLFDYDTKNGSLVARQTVSTLPPGFAGSNFCSEILVSKDGRFLYAGNRLHDSIARYTISNDGTLTYIDGVWTQGNYPRSFEFDPTGSFLYCCNQRSDNVAVFKVDQDSGALSFSGQYVPVGNPSCVVFLE